MKNILRKLPTVFLALFCAFSVSAQENLVIDKVIAKVGGEYILYSELIESYKFQKERDPSLPESAICGLLEQLIAQKILVNQAKLDSIEVGEEELESQLDYRINNILRMMNGDEERFKEHYGKSVLAVKDDFRDDLRQQILADKIQRSLINEVKITPIEVVEFFESIPTDSLPYLNSEVELGEIIYHPKVNPEEKEKARLQLEEVRRRIVEDGEDFAELAARYSQDGTAQNGGDLGWQKRGTFVTEFEAEAYGLDINEISPLVETEFGFHVIQLMERRGNTIRARHILIKPEITQEDLDLARNKLDSVRVMIQNDSLSFEQAVKIYSDKNSMSFNNNGRMVNQNNGSNYFETSELPFEIYFEIENLEVGEITEPISYESAPGETSFRIVKMLSKTRPHRANLQQDYTKISEFAKESKKSIYYNEWMLDKLETTFIEIERDLAGCANLERWMDLTSKR